MVRQRGDIERLHHQLTALRGGEAKQMLIKNMAEEARTQVMNELNESRDPYGNKWKNVLRGGKPLLLTGRMRNSIRGQAMSNGFRLATNVIYAAVHQYGATIKAKSAPYLRFQVGGSWSSKKQVTIPRRQFVPEGKLGPIWTSAFVRVAHRVLDLIRGG